MGIELKIAEDKLAFRPGETLSVTLSWLLETAPDHLLIKLFWHTEGRGTKDVEVVEEHRVEDPGRSGSRRFDFKLPTEPYSFSGKLISIMWGLEAIAEPMSEVVIADFTLSPTGSEIVLVATGSENGGDKLDPLAGDPNDRFRRRP